MVKIAENSHRNIDTWYLSTQAIIFIDRESYESQNLTKV
jgi:hypothetical protein